MFPTKTLCGGIGAKIPSRKCRRARKGADIEAVCERVEASRSSARETRLSSVAFEESRGVGCTELLLFLVVNKSLVRKFH